MTNSPQPPLLPTQSMAEAGVLPLAPPIQPLSAARMAANQRLAVRMWCGFIFVICAAMLGVGLKLSPDAEGLGTHEQLGLPACSWMTFSGYPCPTCGCTTAVSNFAHGHLILSFLTQPFGFAVALLAALLLPLSGWGLATGQWKGPSTFWLGWHWRWWVFGGIAILILGWVYKIIIVRSHITF